MAIEAALTFVYFVTLLSCLLQTLPGVLLPVEWIYPTHVSSETCTARAVLLLI